MRLDQILVRLALALSFASPEQSWLLENLSVVDHLMLSGIDGGSVSVVEINVLDTVLFCF